MNGQNGSAASKDLVARDLARAHRNVDDGIVAIYRLRANGREDLEAEPVKLLEVNKFTARCGIVPIWFGADPAHQIPYPVIVVELHPDELDAVRSKELLLPNEWILDESETL